MKLKSNEIKVWIDWREFVYGSPESEREKGKEKKKRNKIFDKSSRGKEKEKMDTEIRILGQRNQKNKPKTGVYIDI